jgi:hypothetical protein
MLYTKFSYECSTWNIYGLEFLWKNFRKFVKSIILISLFPLFVGFSGYFHTWFSGVFSSG